MMRVCVSACVDRIAIILQQSLPPPPPQAPPFLVFHLRRFTVVGRGAQKVSKFVSYPEVLDLFPFCHGTRLSGGDAARVACNTTQSDLTMVVLSVPQKVHRQQQQGVGTGSLGWCATVAPYWVDTTPATFFTIPLTTQPAPTRLRCIRPRLARCNGTTTTTLAFALPLELKF